MSRLEEIAKKLNGLAITDDFREAMMDYFCEDDDDDNNNDDTDNDDTTGEVNAIPVPLSSTVIPQIDNDLTRPVIWYDACSDDTGTSDTLDKSEDKLVSDFLDKTCCHLKCTERFTKETVLHSRINAQELNHFSQAEHVNFLHVSILGGLNCCVAVGEETMPRIKITRGKELVGISVFKASQSAKSFIFFYMVLATKSIGV